MGSDCERYHGRNALRRGVGGIVFRSPPLLQGGIMNAFTQVIVGKDRSAYVHFGNFSEVFPPSKVKEAREVSVVCANSRVAWGPRDYKALVIYCPCLACRVTHAVNVHQRKLKPLS